MLKLPWPQGCGGSAEDATCRGMGRLTAAAGSGEGSRVTGLEQFTLDKARKPGQNVPSELQALTEIYFKKLFHPIN